MALESSNWRNPWRLHSLFHREHIAYAHSASSSGRNIFIFRSLCVWYCMCYVYKKTHKKGLECYGLCQLPLFELLYNILYTWMTAWLLVVLVMFYEWCHLRGTPSLLSCLSSLYGGWFFVRATPEMQILLCIHSRRQVLRKRYKQAP